MTHSKDLIIRAFNEIIRQEVAEADAVREESKRRGTYWAGDEKMEASPTGRCPPSPIG